MSTPELISTLTSTLTPALTPDQVQTYQRDGVLIIPGFFSPAETAILYDQAHHGERLGHALSNMPDSAGRASRLAIWGSIGADVFGAVSANPRLVDHVEALMGEPCYHWHSKVMFKEPQVGGAWEWHQDYGYWYDDTCPFPRMLSCLISLDRADRANGCLQVLVGSHRLGRLNHGTAGNQSGADPARLALVRERFEVRAIEVDPGTAVFFHCNTLHASGPNESERMRTSYICAYNALSNAPAVPATVHGQPLPIQCAADDAILRAGRLQNA